MVRGIESVGGLGFRSGSEQVVGRSWHGNSPKAIRRIGVRLVRAEEGRNGAFIATSCGPVEGCLTRFGGDIGLRSQRGGVSKG